MKIAIIGAGFTGLSAAYDLTQKGHSVTLYERDDKPGGLAIGFHVKGWQWTLEKHYHHWFANDDFILNLAKAINYKVILKRPITSVLIENEIFQLDSPAKVLSFPKLSPVERFRMSMVLGLLRFNPYWKPLENYAAAKSLPALMGERPYKLLWEPQLKNKFGSFSDDISLAWFWARIKKRTSTLAYPEGGFLQFAEFLTEVLKKSSASFHFKTDVVGVVKKGDQLIITSSKQGSEKTSSNTFDKVLVTLPGAAFTKIAPELPEEYKNSLSGLRGLGAINLVLRLKKPFLKGKTYWLSICDTKAPVMAIVEHTNFMDKAHYNNEHLVYIGNYLPQDHRYFSLSEHDLLSQYDSFLQKIHKGYEKNIIGLNVFKAPFAQPIIPLNYSRQVPDFKTPLKHVYLANMQQVYPWDRGTNYAVELGQKVSKIMLKAI